MIQEAKRWAVILALPLLCLALLQPAVQAQDSQPGDGRQLITGTVQDNHDQPVLGAHVTLINATEAASPSSLSTGESVVAEAETQPDGRFALFVPNPIPDDLILRIERRHFEPAEIRLNSEKLQQLTQAEALILPDVVLTRRISLAFWVATAVFILVLIIMATERLHNTLAALVGMGLVFGFSYLGEPLNEDLFIFNFQDSLRYVDWNVIFLIMGMMIVIAVVERTGVFQWLAFLAYRVSRGRAWLLLPILMVITGIASAFLDNVTTMLLMTPITVQIALSMELNPLALLMPEVMASNVAGVSTLIGTPTNILIGSYGQISFGAFLVNLTPGVVLALIGLVLYSEIIYFHDLKAASTAVSPVLLQKLADNARITEPEHLKKAGWVGLGMLILFLEGERLHLVPAVTALLGATVLLLWVRPNIEEMIEAVDWTTLVFFMALFVVVGAIQEVGLISFVADGISRVIGNSLVLGMLSILWLGAILSTVIANIPFTAAMLPVIGFLTARVPGAGNKALFYSLSVGSAMGGNGSLIGASANMVTAGIAERAGYPITYVYFLKKGFPALLITVGLGMGWLLLRFLVWGS